MILRVKGLDGPTTTVSAINCSSVHKSLVWLLTKRLVILLCQWQLDKVARVSLIENLKIVHYCAYCYVEWFLSPYISSVLVNVLSSQLSLMLCCTFAWKLDVTFLFCLIFRNVLQNIQKFMDIIDVLLSSDWMNRNKCEIHIGVCRFWMWKLLAHAIVNKFVPGRHTFWEWQAHFFFKLKVCANLKYTLFWLKDIYSNWIK